MDGICVYLGILREVTDNYQQLGRIQVIPGVIEHIGRPFSCIEGHKGWSSFSREDVEEMHHKMEYNHSRVFPQRWDPRNCSFFSHPLHVLDEGKQNTGTMIKPYHLVANDTFSRGLVS